MNIYFNQPPFAPVLGLFVAKYSAIWCKIRCNMPLNAMRFGAKCSAFWCKTQGKMVQNAVQNGAKRKTKSIKIRRNSINITFQNHETHGQKGQNSHQKVGFQGQKAGNSSLKNTSWQPKQKGKMVQNAAFVLKNRQRERWEKLKIAAKSMLDDLNFRQKEVV